MSKTKPCPFCGSVTDTLCSHNDDTNEDRVTLFCKGCDAEMSDEYWKPGVCSRSPDMAYDTVLARLVRQWNTRT